MWWWRGDHGADVVVATRGGDDDLDSGDFDLCFHEHHQAGGAATRSTSGRQRAPLARPALAARRPSSRACSVLQNQHLLVDHGIAASNLTSCVLACWGYTIESLSSVARSSLGITRDGSLVWAAGEALTPTQLAAANTSAGVRRAIELDINPAWVAGYLYLHMAGGPVADPVVPGQRGIAGQLLGPYSRDFLTFVAR